MISYRHVVALGSSFAAGPGIDPIVDRAAMLSGRNYAHLLAERLGAELTDPTVSGATTATIVDRPQRTLRGRRFAPQVDGIRADADLVTITTGGNDLRYIGSMIRAAWAGWMQARPLIRPLGRALGRSAVPAAAGEDVGKAADGLARVVAAARVRAPRARVVLVDYLTVVGADTIPSAVTPLTVSEIAALRHTVISWGAFAEAAERTGAELVQASALSRGHGLGSPEPWVTGFRPALSGAAFHPNASACGRSRTLSIVR